MDQRAMELLEHGLKDMYDAEQRFASALGTMESNAHDKSLANGFKRHRDVTENQVKRIEKAFREIGQEPTKETCKGAAGLIAEYESFAEDHVGGDGLLDAFSATAGLKVEHYEIASYRSLIDLAEFCDQDEVASLLRKNLAEEEQAAAEMSSAATKLGAKLAGASVSKVAARGVGSMLDHMRESTLAAVGSAQSTAGRATDKAISGRKALAKRAATARRKRATAARKTKKTARKTKTTASRTTTAARRKTSARKSTRPKSRAKATTRGRATARKSPARRSTARKSPARKSRRKSR